MVALKLYLTDNSTRKHIPQNLVAPGPISLRVMAFHTDIGKMFQEVEPNPGYSSFSHNI